MRPWATIAAALSVGAATTAPTATVQRYRFATEEISITTGEMGPLIDTTLTTDVVSVTTVDSAGAMFAAVVVDSVWLGHHLEPDGSGITWRARIVVGQPLGAPALSYVTVPPLTLVSSVIGTMAYLFPVVPRAPKAGEQWSDTSRTGLATTISTWTITNEHDGVFDATIIDRSHSVATDIGGEEASSESTTTRTITSTRIGPVRSATIRRETHVTGSIPGESPLSVIKTSTTRIVQLN